MARGQRHAPGRQPRQRPPAAAVIVERPQGGPKRKAQQEDHDKPAFCAATGGNVPRVERQQQRGQQRTAGVADLGCGGKKDRQRDDADGRTGQAQAQQAVVGDGEEGARHPAKGIKRVVLQQRQGRIKQAQSHNAFCVDAGRRQREQMPHAQRRAEQDDEQRQRHDRVARERQRGSATLVVGRSLVARQADRNARLVELPAMAGRAIGAYASMPGRARHHHAHAQEPERGLHGQPHGAVAAGPEIEEAAGQRRKTARDKERLTGDAPVIEHVWRRRSPQAERIGGKKNAAGQSQQSAVTQHVKRGRTLRHQPQRKKNNEEAEDL